jgi:hypothetical protein
VLGNVGIGTSSPTNKLQVTGGGLTVNGTSPAFTANAAIIDVSGSITRISAAGPDNTTNGTMAFNTASANAGVFNERMRIDSTGNVGIGTSSPSGKLQIDSTNVDPSATATGITLINSTSSQATNNGGSISLGGVYTGTSITQFGYILGAKANSTDGNYAGYLSFGTRPNGDVSQERMRIDSSGNVGIGTSSPAAPLDIGGNPTYQNQMIWSRGVGDASFKAVLASGDAGSQATIGSIGVRYSNYKDFASIQFYRNSTVGNLLFFTGGLSADGTEKMRLTPTTLYTAFGVNVGIGVTNPNSALSIITSNMSNQIVLGVNPSNTVYGGISFNGNLADGAHLGIGGGGSGDPNLYIDVPNSGQFLFRQGSLSTNAMVLNASGNLGLGATNPTDTNNFGRALDIRSGTGGAAYFRDSDDATKYNVAGFFGADSNGYFGTWGAGTGLLFFSSGVERMQIDSSGNVKVNSPSASQYVQLQPDGSIRSVHANGVGGDSIYSAITGISNGYQISVTVGNAQTYKWHNGATQSMTLNASGQLLVGGTLEVSGAKITVESGFISVGNTSNLTQQNTLLLGYGYRIGASLYGQTSIRSTYENNSNTATLELYSSFGRVMTLDASGNLLVGTTSNTTNGGFILSPDFYGVGRSTQIIGHSSSGANLDAYIIFNYNGSGIGSIIQNGVSAVLYLTTSDERLKTNVINAPSGNIDNIKVRSFDWIADGSHQEYGMVAQELLEVAPYAVCNPKNPDEMMAVDYSKLVPMMIKEIQDLKARLLTLENK